MFEEHVKGWSASENYITLPSILEVKFDIEEGKVKFPQQIGWDVHNVEEETYRAIHFRAESSGRSFSLFLFPRKGILHCTPGDRNLRPPAKIVTVSDEHVLLAFPEDFERERDVIGKIVDWDENEKLAAEEVEQDDPMAKVSVKTKKNYLSIIKSNTRFYRETPSQPHRGVEWTSTRAMYPNQKTIVVMEWLDAMSGDPTEIVVINRD